MGVSFLGSEPWETPPIVWSLETKPAAEVLLEHLSLPLWGSREPPAALLEAEHKKYTETINEPRMDVLEDSRSPPRALTLELVLLHGNHRKADVGFVGASA